MSERLKKNVPVLRFPDFDGDWIYTLLWKVPQYTKGFAFKSEDYMESGVRIVRASDLNNQSVRQDNQKVYISVDLAKNKKIIKYG